MKNAHTFLTRYRLRYRRTSPLIKVMVATVIVLSSVTLVTLRVGQWQAEKRLADLRRQAEAMELRNEELRQDIEKLGTTDSVRKIAREELGLVDPDTILFEQAD